MNISIIYGTTKKTCTYNCVQMLLKSIKLTIPITVKEFFLEKDSPDYNCDFFSCYVNNEIIYPKGSHIDYLTNSIDSSDLIILASPVIECSTTIELNTLLNYLNYNSKSFLNTKLGLVISTTAGAGLSYTTNSLKKNLIFLGIQNVFSFSSTLYEMNWEEVSLKTKIKITKKIFKVSNKILNLYINSNMVKDTISDAVPVHSYKFKLFSKDKSNNIINVNFKAKHTYPNYIRKIH